MLKITLSLAISGLLSTLVLTAVQPSHAQAAIDSDIDAVGADEAAQTDNVVRDAQGNAQYTIEVDDSAVAKYSDASPQLMGFPNWQRPSMQYLARALEADYGFKATAITSHVGNLVFATLTSDQAAALARDPRVRAIDTDRYVEYSGAIWADSTGAGGEIRSWGKNAVGGITNLSRVRARVYVVDGGVGQHQDLNVVERVWPIYPTTNMTDLVHCYAHATHVAGIIGARNNAHGSLGIDPDAPIVSVTAAVPPAAGANVDCNGTVADNNSIIAALDWIAVDVQARNTVGIVSMSLNPPVAGPGDPAWQGSGNVAMAMKKLATPGLASNNGSLLVTSAGNGYKDACPYVFGPTSVANDGIMVVGGIDDHGQPPSEMHCTSGSSGIKCIGGFRNTSAATEAGSNFGQCVEVWAPASLIRSTFVAGKQFANVVYDTYGLLSGTSMAAPHVAGLAAAMFDNAPAKNSLVLEGRVKAKMQFLGSFDHSGLPISISTLNASVPTAQPKAEFAIHVGGAGNQFIAADVNAVVTMPSTSRFNLSFDSVGAVAPGCDLSIADYFIPSFPAVSYLTTTQRQQWTQLQYPPLSNTQYNSHYRFLSSCDTGTSDITITP